MSTKRILSLVLAMVMVLGTFGSLVFAEGTGNEKVDELIELGLVQGYGDGTYGLDKTITRAEVATMVARALDADEEAKAMQNMPSPFTDMNNLHWANGYVNFTVGKGIVNGYPDRTFKPSNDITYAEVAKMLVEVMGGLTEAEAKTAVWPATYLAKAAELGIVRGVNVVDYTAKAVRANVFEMIHNAYFNMEVGHNTIVKAIVLENNRVERIGADEVVVEIIRELQRSNYADASRVEKGDQERFTIALKGQNVEEMLGKVYDFTLNRDGKVIQAKLDNTYEYKQGPITANKGRLTLGGSSYTVELGERYRETDERIFRTYHNDNAYAYEDFYQDPATIENRNRPASFSVDYARVTVKNGKVLYIDSFTFEDIAPVKDVRRNGLDVYVYNDFRDAREEKFEPRQLVVAYNDGVFSRIEREAIDTNDVVHVYAKNKLIVRQDALVEGTYTKVEKDRFGTYYAHVADEAYVINEDDYRRPVYAHDSKSYSTLFANEAQRELANFFKTDVKILVDIKDNLQLFGANVEYNEGMAIVEQILARGQGKFVLPTDERAFLDETYDSIITTRNLDGKVSTTNQRLSSFDRYDLVFVNNDGDNIDTLARIKTEGQMRANLKKLVSTKAVDMNNDFVRVQLTNDTTDRYQVLKRTNVFVVGGNGAISATTVGKLQASLRPGSEIEVYVLSDAEATREFEEHKVRDRNRISDKTDVAHTLVFFAPDYAFVAEGETVKVNNLYTATTPHYLVGQKADNVGKDTVERTAARGVRFDSFVNATENYKLNVNDIVSLKLTKDDDKLVQRVELLIAANAFRTNSYKVVGGDLGRGFSQYEYRRLLLEDAKGFRDTYWLVGNAEEFGTITLDSIVTFHLTGNTDRTKDIDVIQVHANERFATANADPVAPKKYPFLVNAYRRLNQEITLEVLEEVNGRIVTNVYNYVGAQTLAELIALEGKTVDLGKVVLKGEVVLNLVTEAKENGELNKVELDAVMASAATKVEAEYTAESFAALTAAKAMAETTQAEVNAKVAALKAALAGLVKVEEGNEDEVKVVTEFKSNALTGRVIGKLEIPASLKDKVEVKVYKADVEQVVEVVILADGTVEIEGLEFGKYDVRVLVNGVKVHEKQILKLS